MLRSTSDASTIDHVSSSLTADQEASRDLYQKRLRQQPITPLQWIRDNPHIPATPEYHKMLWDHYAIEYPPPRVPGFVIEDVLGEGGMGRVFLGTDNSLKRRVAIKELTAALRPGGSAADRFRLEAKILAKLEHPNIVKVHQLVSHDQRDFIAMEYAANGTLAERLGAARDVSAISSNIAKLARALDYAHGQNIIHRDLKPSNILFDKDDEPKLSDFGLAKDLSDPTDRSLGNAVGTHHYMAPEQIEAKPPVPGTDIWALGVILYRAFAGRLPFDGQTVDEVYGAIRTGLPQGLPATIPADLRRICLKCLEKDPSRRYQRGNDLAADLEKVTIANEPPPWRRWMIAAAMILVLIGSVAIAFPAIIRQPNPPAVVPAELLSMDMSGKLPGPTKSIAYTADGRFGLAEVSGGRFLVWDLPKGQLDRTVDHGQIREANCGAITASDDGQWIAVLGSSEFFGNAGTQGGLVYLDLFDAKLFEKKRVSFEDNIYGLPASFSHDSRKLAFETHEHGQAIGKLLGPGKSRLAIYDIESTKWTYIPVPAAITCLAFSTDSQFVITGSIESSMNVWNLATRGSERKISVSAGGVDAVAYSDDGARIYTASIADDSLGVYKSAGDLERAITMRTATAEKSTSAAISRLGCAVTGHRDGAVVYWNLQSGEHRLLRRRNAEVTALAIARDGSQALAAFSDGIVTLYQLPGTVK